MSPRHRYTLKPDTSDSRDLCVASVSPALLATLPPRVDLYECMPAPPPIWNQGNLGSCTGHGGARAHEINRRIQGAAPRDPSRLFIYYEERKIEGTLAQDAGAQIRTCAKVMAQFGVPSSLRWPNDAKNFNTVPNVDAYAEAAQFQVDQYQRVAVTPEAICAQLAQGKPIIFGFSVFESFENAEVARTGIVPMPKANEKNFGGHCVCVTGYEINAAAAPTRRGFLEVLRDRLFGSSHPPRGYLICDNSWGDTWGARGRFRLPFEFLTRGLVWDAWAIQHVEPAPPTP